MEIVLPACGYGFHRGAFYNVDKNMARGLHTQDKKIDLENPTNTPLPDPGSVVEARTSLQRWIFQIPHSSCANFPGPPSPGFIEASCGTANHAATSYPQIPEAHLRSTANCPDRLNRYPLRLLAEEGTGLKRASEESEVQVSRQQPQAQNCVDRQDRRLWSSRERSAGSAVRSQPSPQARARRLRLRPAGQSRPHKLLCDSNRSLKVREARALFRDRGVSLCRFCRLLSARYLADHSGRPSASPHRSRRQATPEQKRSIRLRRRRAARRAGPWSEHVRSVAIMERLERRKWRSDHGKFAVFRTRIGVKIFAPLKDVRISRCYEQRRGLATASSGGRSATSAETACPNTFGR